MNRICTVLAVLLCGASMLMAHPIDQGQALLTARQFASQRGWINPSATLKAAPIRRQLPAKGHADEAPYYVFNIGEGEGFVIVAGDDAAIPVLGYSLKGTFLWDDMPANLRQWMKMNEMYIERCRESGRIPVSRSLQRGEPVQSPLLGDILWGQDNPYNLLCPSYTSAGATQHYYAGCVATAATQIMRYYCYPEQGYDKKTYTDTKGCGESLSADFGNTSYDWSNMLFSYRGVTATQAQQQAVATLAYHFGVAVDMEYHAAGSGAVSSVVPHAFRHYFRYDDGVTMRKRNYYDTSEWMEIIKREIDQRRPVYYAASSEDGQGGHAFVCDGYDTADFVHINWGWYGDYNGYFSINHLEPAGVGEGGGKGAYNIDQEIITGIQPPTGTQSEYERPLYFSTMMTCNDFGDVFSIGGTIENYEATPFTGQIGAVLERNGEVIAVLKAENQNIAAYSNRRTGYIMGFVVRDAGKTVTSGIEDGEAFVRVAFRESEADNWKFMRHAIGRNPQGQPYGTRIKAKVNNGHVEIIGVEQPVLDVTIVGKVAPEIEDVFAGGSLVLPLTLRNDSKHFHLNNVVVRFQSVDDEAKVYDYENKVNIYDGSTENLRLLINLKDDMPAGDYRIVVYEKGFEEYPFKETGANDVVTVLPQVDYPVMHLTQNVLWQRNDGTLTANQGDRIYFALNSRNYGAEGSVGVILYLVDVDDPSRRYMYQQADAYVTQGEAKTLTFYRQMPVDPGKYFIQVSYVTADGKATDDSRSAYYADTITVGEGTDIKMNGVEVNLPDEVVRGQRLEGYVSFEALEAYRGYVYVRMRQFSLTNGGILNMGSVNVDAGEKATINISSTITYDIGRYIVMYDFGTSSTRGVGSYKNVYKIIDVVGTTTGIDATPRNDENVEIFVDGDRFCVATRGDVQVKRIEVLDLNGRTLKVNRQYNDINVGDLNQGVYIVRVATSEGNFTKKMIRR